MSGAYPDVVARFYDAVYAHVRDAVDKPWYLERMAKAGGPVLEIGCGTGRLLRAALARGTDAWGVDVSPRMVERCREQLPPEARARVTVADAVSMRLERRFAAIVAPFRVLSHVVAVADQLRLLDNVHEHLIPGGRFLFNLYVPNPRILAEGIPGQCDFDGEHAPGRRLRRLVSARSDVVRQVTSVHMEFVWDEEGGERRAGWDFEMRFYFRWEIEHLVARSKLRLESIHGDFAGGELGPDSREFVVACRREG